MGLDMFLYATTEDEEGRFDADNREEIGYWRKHPNLHSYIEDLWRVDGGYGDFNCVPYKLSREQIQGIIQRSRAHNMPTSPGGFFFSESQPEDDPETVEIMEKALARMDDDPDTVIVYDSWW